MVRWRVDWDPRGVAWLFAWGMDEWCEQGGRSVILSSRGWDGMVLHCLDCLCCGVLCCGVLCCAVVLCFIMTAGREERRGKNDSLMKEADAYAPPGR